MNSPAVQNDPETYLPQLFELAKHLVPTGMLPEHLKTPGQVVAIILAGRELGMPPMRALRSLTLVKGKVVEAADSQLARFKADGGKAVFEALDDEHAVLRLTHPNGDEHVEKFTMLDAKRAGLTANQTWAKYPKAMLRSRVITAGLKSVGWDGAVGNYDPDEAREIAPPQPVIQMPKRLSDRTKPLVFTSESMEEAREALEDAQAAADPDLLDLLERSVAEVNARADEIEENEPPVEYISESQRRHLLGLANENKHSHAAVKAWLARRGVSSSKEITTAMYDRVRARLADPTPLES